MQLWWSASHRDDMKREQNDLICETKIKWIFACRYLPMIFVFSENVLEQNAADDRIKLFKIKLGCHQISSIHFFSHC